MTDTGMYVLLHSPVLLPVHASSHCSSFPPPPILPPSFPFPLSHPFMHHPLLLSLLAPSCLSSFPSPSLLSFPPLTSIPPSSLPFPSPSLSPLPSPSTVSPPSKAHGREETARRTPRSTARDNVSKSATASPYLRRETFSASREQSGREKCGKEREWGGGE